VMHTGRQKRIMAVWRVNSAQHLWTADAIALSTSRRAHE
jgi:hypothetical protein